MAPFLISAIVAPLIRLRGWPLITLVGGLLTPALLQALWRIAPEHTLYGFDQSLLAGVPLLAAVAGFAVAAWVPAAPGHWRSRIAVLAVLAVVCALAIPLEGPARRWHEARGFELLGVPLAAPEVSGHTLYDAAAPIVNGRFEPAEPVIILEYRRVGSEAVSGSFEAVQVFVRHRSTATAAAACATPDFAEPGKDESGSCRAASRNRWVRHGKNGLITVFAHRAARWSGSKAMSSPRWNSSRLRRRHGRSPPRLSWRISTRCGDVQTMATKRGSATCLRSAANAGQSHYAPDDHAEWLKALC